MLTNEQFTYCAERYIDTVFRVAYNYLRSATDADDITQNVFLKLIRSNRNFETEEHIKNWLIRVTINECTDLVRSRWWKSESIEEHTAEICFDTQAHSDLFYMVMDLPKKYRLPIYLHYYEEYTTAEIAKILHIPKNTVCTNLRRGRELLKNALQEV